ncbi:hypothetical protein, partial [Achromobacter ruhlandii]|uniref:hypothetical protein n=1 Tax=Achromobacter ruhlandii TaxID=72557 RepID=UPI001C12BBD2
MLDRDGVGADGLEHDARGDLVADAPGQRRAAVDAEDGRPSGPAAITPSTLICVRNTSSRPNHRATGPLSAARGAGAATGAGLAGGAGAN